MSCEYRRTRPRPRTRADDASPPGPTPDHDRARAGGPMVVIMIGRKRMRQPSVMASSGSFLSLRCASTAKSISDGVLLDDADHHDEPDEGVDVELDAEEERHERAEPLRGEPRGS